MSNIIVIDDDASVRSLLQDVLAGKGHACATACDGPEALDKIARGRYDLVILDHNMPKMTGTEVLFQLRSDPRHAKLPVVICTSDALFQRKAEAGTATGNPAGCVQKPIDMEKLIALVAKLTSTSKTS